ncbi:MAG TPA: hypothetical protein PKC59_12265 [Burkholderiaceae bacterium]|nr:hypothetical protein [Burkholderiaceae bacterium]HMZ02334.1 hypothetical protein [Burkholderiaceae bacterium]HNB46460.1 hypothetical protein [Burkholderiaceae bacterium]HNG81277.1 hypothetical protein [Burkholderiaceae bacterium]
MPIPAAFRLLPLLRWRAVLALTAWIGAAGPVCAGRPLATDDAGTVGAGRCQVEAWGERGHGSSGLVLAPACGLGESVEIGLELRRLHGQELRRSSALALKWVDPDWRAGPWRFGFKAYGGTQRQRDGTVEAMSTGALLLGSVDLRESLQLHLNLGDEYDRGLRRHHAHSHAALTWEPGEAWQVFAELYAAQGQGGAMRGAGLRRWLIKDRLGLDLTGMHVPGNQGPTLWTLGLGWYGAGQ